jgi:anti-sigma factor RsiW
MFAWLDGELTRAQARVIERHLATCGCCGGLAGDLRQAIAACRMAGDCRVPKDVHRRAKARAKALLRQD